MFRHSRLTMLLQSVGGARWQGNRLNVTERFW